MAVNLVRTAAAAATAAILVSGGPVEITYLLAGVCAAADAIVRPIQIALMPALARTPTELIAANVTTSIGEGVSAFIGPLIGGTIVVAAGPAAASATAGLAFLVATAAVVQLRFQSDADARGRGSRHVWALAPRSCVPFGPSVATPTSAWCSSTSAARSSFAEC